MQLRQRLGGKGGEMTQTLYANMNKKKDRDSGCSSMVEHSCLKYTRLINIQYPPKILMF
jgi:hypothetical protein